MSHHLGDLLGVVVGYDPRRVNGESISMGDGRGKREGPASLVFPRRAKSSGQKLCARTDHFPTPRRPPARNRRSKIPKFCVMRLKGTSAGPTSAKSSPATRR